MRVTAIMNLKGGTGKTITAINVGAIMAREWAQRVLLADADSQANLTEFVTDGLLPDGISLGGMTDLLQKGEAFPVATNLKNVQLLHADETLMGLDISTAQNGKSNPMALAEWLGTKEVQDRYDRCVIDCPPAFSAAAMAALIAADEVVIPVKLDAFGIRGVSNLVEQIRNMRSINPDLEIAGVLPTMYYSTHEQKEALDLLRGRLARMYIRTFHAIRRSVKVDDSTFAQYPLIVSSPKSKATHDYKLLVRDLMTEGGEDDGV